MKIFRSCLVGVCAAAALVLVASAAPAQLTDDDRKCSDKMNNDAKKVLDQEAKGNRKECVKGQTGDQEVCIDADQPKSTEKGTKLIADFGVKCATLPAFGVNADATAIVDAAQTGADRIARGIFGDPVDGLDASKCQDKLIQRSGQLSVAIWKAYRKCVKDLASINTIADIEGCIASGITTGEAAKGQKVNDDAADKCAAFPPTATEDGICGGEFTANDFANCVRDLVDCQTCIAMNEATGASANCDQLDDGAVNGSCGCGNRVLEPGEDCDPAGFSGCAAGTTGEFCDSECHCIPASTHKCTFDGNTDNSNLAICFDFGCPFSSLIPSGAVDIACGPQDGGTGKRECVCGVQTFNPVTIPGIGVVCIEPSPGCGLGEADCDGGNSLGVDHHDDHEIGACTSHSGCTSQCTTFCTGLGKQVWRATCEGLCLGGDNNNLPCDCDATPAATCTTEDPAVCPGGTCVGKDDERGTGDLDCNCQCVDYAAGGASAAGDLQCLLGAKLTVEGAVPCDNIGILIRLPPICAPLSSQEATGFTDNVNEIGGATIGPTTNTGLPESCANFDASVTTGFELVTDLGFLDSTLGDLRSQLRLDCQ